MNLATLIDFLNEMNTKNGRLENYPILFWLNKFIETQNIKQHEGEQRIVHQFSQYLKENSPELYERVFDKWRKEQDITAFWELICSSGEPAAITYLLEKKIIGKDSESISGLNILHLAASSGNVAAMEKAIEIGIDPRSETKKGKNLLYYVHKNPNEEAIYFAKRKYLESKNNNAPDTINDDIIVFKRQTWFMHIINQMGIKDKYNGMCFATTQYAMQAALAGEVNNFDSRILLLQSYVGEFQRLKNDIDEAKNAVKHKVVLTDKQEKLLEVQAFLEGIALYQSPAMSKELLNDKENKNYLMIAEQLRSITIPAKLEKNDGRIEEICRVQYNDDKNLNDFLNKLKKICESRDFPISVVLNKWCSYVGHAINLSYDPKEKSWKLIDANNLPSVKFEFNDLSSLKHKINEFLDIVPYSPPMKYSAEIYAHNDNTKKDTISALKAETAQEFFPTMWQRVKRLISKILHPGEETIKAAKNSHTISPAHDLTAKSSTSNIMQSTATNSPNDFCVKSPLANNNTSASRTVFDEQVQQQAKDANGLILTADKLLKSLSNKNDKDSHTIIINVIENLKTAHVIISSILEKKLSDPAIARQAWLEYSRVREQCLHCISNYNTNKSKHISKDECQTIQRPRG